MYEEHQVLTSVHIQKVWLEATKRRKRDLTPLPYFLMETKVPKNGKEENEVQDVLFPPENACNSEQSKEKQSKEKEHLHLITIIRTEHVPHMYGLAMKAWSVIHNNFFRWY